MLNKFYIDDIIKTALNEDINYIDVATDNLIPEDKVSSCYFVAKESGILCGLDIAMRVFSLLDGEFSFDTTKKDGDELEKGEKFLTFKGHTRALLKGERTALNLIQHMSGIATATSKCVSLIEGTRATIADTRKTLPGLRALQKYAVTVGGGKNHRFNLSDAAMLKDNHIDAEGGIIPAVAKLKEKIGHTVKIEVETRTLDEVRDAITAKADIIMLDNMSPETMKEAIRLIDGNALVEASGGITEKTIRAVAESGVDIISIGAITHSVTALDISMKYEA